MYELQNLIGLFILDRSFFARLVDNLSLDNLSELSDLMLSYHACVIEVSKILEDKYQRKVNADKNYVLIDNKKIKEKGR